MLLERAKRVFHRQPSTHFSIVDYIFWKENIE